MSQKIIPYFQKADLPIIVTDKPFARGRDTDKIFQMTIEGKKPETFKVFKGVGTEVRVVDVDQYHRQVLLFVKEPKRTFTEIQRKNGKDVEVSRETSSEIKRYLAGMDERHLFISELPKAKGKINTVDDAHKLLKPKEVAKNGKKPVRQGEWFFVDITPEESLLIKEKAHAALYDTALPTRGKPHTCDQYLKITDPLRGELTFIIGRVTHADHKTLEFNTWQRVYRNTEPINPRGVHGWID